MQNLIDELLANGFELEPSGRKVPESAMFTHTGFQGSVETKIIPGTHLLVDIYGSVEGESVQFAIAEATLHQEPKALIQGVFIPTILWLNRVIG